MNISTGFIAFLFDTTITYEYYKPRRTCSWGGGGGGKFLGGCGGGGGGVGGGGGGGVNLTTRGGDVDRNHI